VLHHPTRLPNTRPLERRFLPGRRHKSNTSVRLSPPARHATMVVQPERLVEMCHRSQPCRPKRTSFPHEHRQKTNLYRRQKIRIIETRLESLLRLCHVKHRQQESHRERRACLKTMHRPQKDTPSQRYLKQNPCPGDCYRHGRLGSSIEHSPRQHDCLRFLSRFLEVFPLQQRSLFVDRRG